MNAWLGLALWVLASPFMVVAAARAFPPSHTPARAGHEPETPSEQDPNVND